MNTNDYIEFKVSPEMAQRFKANQSKTPNTDVQFRTFDGKLALGREGDAEMLHNMKLLFKSWVENGRVEVHVTEAMCRSFENVSIDIPRRDYRQPYPTMRILFPKGMYHNDTIGAAGFAIIHNQPQLTGHGEEMACVMCIECEHEIACFSEDMRYQPDEGIETTLFANGAAGFGESQEYVRRITRVVLNTCLALTHYPTRLRSPQAPCQWPRAKRRAWEATAPKVVDFIDQNIKWYDEENTPSQRGEAGDGHHARPVAHWRRGHWRRQVHGAGRAERKLVFIRPILVNAAYYAPATPDAAHVQYEGTDPRSKPCP